MDSKNKIGIGLGFAGIGGLIIYALSKKDGETDVAVRNDGEYASQDAGISVAEIKNIANKAATDQSSAETKSQESYLEESNVSLATKQIADLNAAIVQLADEWETELLVAESVGGSIYLAKKEVERLTLLKENKERLWGIANTNWTNATNNLAYERRKETGAYADIARLSSVWDWVQIARLESEIGKQQPNISTYTGQVTMYAGQKETLRQDIIYFISIPSGTLTIANRILSDAKNVFVENYETPIAGFKELIIMFEAAAVINASIAGMTNEEIALLLKEGEK